MAVAAGLCHHQHHESGFPGFLNSKGIRRESTKGYGFGEPMDWVAGRAHFFYTEFVPERRIRFAWFLLLLIALDLSTAAMLKGG
jgi:hypothetical protein